MNKKGKTNTRLLAATALLSLFEHGSTLSVVLAEVESSDKGFIQEICFGVMRWYWRLDKILSLLLRKPLKAKDHDVHVLLLVGLYQIIYMRVPNHAAVNETVNAAKALKKQWAVKLVNGVLQQFIRNQDQLLTQADKDDVALYAHPAWLLERLQQAYSDRWLAIVKAGNEHPPCTLRVNTLVTSKQAYMETLAEQGVEAREHDIAENALIIDAQDITALPGYKQGAFAVQDAAAQLVVDILDLKPEMRVLDACAAPGGKTCHMYAACAGTIDITAIDNQQSRLDTLDQNCQRLQVKAQGICADASDPATWWDGKQYHRILIDAPCSATGVIRRHPDIKYLRSEEDINELVEKQYKLLHALWPLLAKDGILVYATCSILPEENTKQLQRFITQTDDAKHYPIEAPWGMNDGLGRQILPGEKHMDGFYYGRLQKLS